MEKVDLATVIQETISAFCRNRVGDKPPVYVMLSPALTQVPWKSRVLREFVRGFLYESLLSSDPEASVEVKLRRRSPLKDLNAFIGIEPSYWVQLRVSGRGLRIREPVVEELFADIGYRCEEWLGVEGSAARMGIFGAVAAAASKMVFCFEGSRGVLKTDLLLPVFENTAPYLIFCSETRTQRP